MANPIAMSSAQPRPISGRSLKIEPPQQPLPHSIGTLRSGHLTLDTLSPVNQNGSFEFDRVIKAGEVLKRTRRTRAWKPIYLVLRPNLLSIYRDSTETKLRHQITLSDLTAVARQKDPKGKAQHVFALFSPSRNYHLEARNDKEAQEWIELIRREARIDEDEEEMTLATPGGARGMYSGFGRHPHREAHTATTGYSSSDAETLPPFSPMRRGHQTSTILNRSRRVSHTMDYSGPEQASYSDFSDSPGPAAHMSALSLSHTEQHGVADQTQPQQGGVGYGNLGQVNIGPSNISQAFAQEAQEQRNYQKQDEERVVRHGWVYLLKTTSGVRQWKKLWMVLRPKSWALYKNEEEYSAVLVVAFGNIIDAVDIDPISHSKRYCLQIITEEKSYRLCAPDEDSLTRWLGTFKSLLIRRKELQLQRNKTS